MFRIKYLHVRINSEYLNLTWNFFHLLSIDAEGILQFFYSRARSGDGRLRCPGGQVFLLLQNFLKVSVGWGGGGGTGIIG